jgi:hypothetical protein
MRVEERIYDLEKTVDSLFELLEMITAYSMDNPSNRDWVGSQISKKKDEWEHSERWSSQYDLE